MLQCMLKKSTRLRDNALSSFSSSCLLHVRCDTNVVAHRLSKLAFHFEHGFFSFEEYPNLIRNALIVDCNGT